MKTRHNSRYSCKVKMLKKQIAFMKERLEVISGIAEKRMFPDGGCQLDWDFYNIWLKAGNALSSDPLTKKQERRIKCAKS